MRSIKSLYHFSKYILIIAAILLMTAQLALSEESSISVKGEGAPNPSETSIESSKKSAVIAAFLDGLRNILEKINEQKGIKYTKEDKNTNSITISLKGKVGEIEVSERTIVDTKLAGVVEDEVVIRLNNQEISMKEFQLITPVSQINFPEIDKLPVMISGTEIKELKLLKDGACELILVYDANQKSGQTK